MSDTVTIDARYCGPPTSGNGGYTAGALAQAMGIGAGDAVEIRLRVPPPLEVDLTVERDGEVTRLVDHTGAEPVVVAEGRRVDAVELDPPTAATLLEATTATTPFDADQHPFPTCFACGPGRAPGDGLRLFAGTVADRDDIFATVWTPDASLAGPDGTVRPEIVYAALDCPGGQAVSVFGADETAVLLGTITASHLGTVQVGQQYVLTSWRIASEGRKHITGVVLTDADGRELGRSRAVWIAVPAAS